PIPSATSSGCTRSRSVAKENRRTYESPGTMDGSSGAGLVRDSNGTPTGLTGFGNLNLYRARLVLQSVTDVVPQVIDYSASGTPRKGDSRRATPAATEETKRAVEAFGGPNEANGVIVSFGVANEIPHDEGSKGRDSSPDGILFQATFDMDRLGKQPFQDAMRHV